MSTLEIIGLITGILTILGAVVGLTRYITQLQLQVRLDRSETEKSHSLKSSSDLAAANQLLLEELAVARRSGGAASAKKAEIEEELRSLISLLKAEAGSVYLPLKNESLDEVLGLVFVALEPISEQTMKLRKKVIPLHSLAGRCFTDARSLVVANAKASDDHYDKADKVSGYRTEDSLNIPLKVDTKIVGVLQLLNKKGDGKFTEDDLKKLQGLSSKMARKVEEFSILPSNFELLGVAPDSDSQNATILFCDLTASSTLFQELNLSAAVSHINEYLEEMCNVAFRHGGTVDKYMGDGALFRFNVPHPVENHPFAALQAAVEMKSTFDALKKDWLTMGDGANKIYTRAALAYGPVKKATVGHPQYQYLTIFGRAVNAAVNLCENAPRDRNTVLIDHYLHEQLIDQCEVTEVPASSLNKVLKYTPSAFEVSSLK